TSRTMMSGRIHPVRLRGERMTGAGLVRGPGAGSGLPVRSAIGGVGPVCGRLSAPGFGSGVAPVTIIVLSEASGCLRQRLYRRVRAQRRRPGASALLSVMMDARINGARARSGLRLGMPLAIAAALSFGMSGAWARGLIDAGWTPGAAVTVRIWVAALVLLVPAVIALRGRWSLLRRNAGMIIAYGLLAVTATQLFYFQAVAVMDVGIALLIEYTAPVAVVLWLWLRRGERPTRRSILGAVIAFV